MTNEIWKFVGAPTKDFLRLCKVLHPSRKSISLHRRTPDFSIHSEVGELKESLLPDETLTEQRYGFRNVGEIPKGYLGVYVGPEMRRFVIPAVYLSLPDFRVLMERAAEEFGFEQEGALRFPCEVEDFEEVLIRCYARHQNMNKRKQKLIR